MRHRLVRRGLLAGLAAGTAGWEPLAAQAVVTADSSTARAVAPGVVLRRAVWPAGPWVVHALAVDLRTPELGVETAHGLDAVAGRERTTAIATRSCAPGRRAVAAVNGDLFDMATGESEGNQVVAGVVIKAGAAADSP